MTRNIRVYKERNIPPYKMILLGLLKFNIKKNLIWYESPSVSPSDIYIHASNPMVSNARCVSG